MSTEFILPREDVVAALRFGVLYARVGKRLTQLRHKGDQPSRKVGCYLINSCAGDVSVQITHTTKFREEKLPRSYYSAIVIAQ